MQSHRSFLQGATPKAKGLLAVAAVLVGGQLMAMGMVCSHQVQKAEVRMATLQVQQTAMSDCLQYIPSATIGSCNRPAPVAARQVQPQPAGAMAASAVPVSFTYR